MFRFLFCINILNLFLFYFLIRHLQSCTSPIMHLICPPKVLHKVCFSFLLSITAVPSASSETQDESFSSTDERAPGYRLSSNYFQKFKREPAPDWAPKPAPNQRTVSPEFFSWVRTRRLLSCHTCPVRSPSFCVQGKLLFSTFLTRNEGTTDESKKRLGCY